MVFVVFEKPSVLGRQPGAKLSLLFTYVSILPRWMPDEPRKIFECYKRSPYNLVAFVGSQVIYGTSNSNTFIDDVGLVYV